MTTRPEPEWDQVEQGWMLGLDEYRKTEQCPTCGRPKWVCQSAEAERLFEAGDPVRCHATTAVMRGQAGWLDGPHDAYEQALSWPLKVKGSSS